MRFPSSSPMRPAAAMLLGALLLSPVAAVAQVDSREGIALQNQILQLRQQVEQLRRGGGTAPPVSSSRGGGGGEIAAQVLERLGRLEEEVRRMRGRLDELDYANRQQAQALEKLQGDIDFRLQQLEGGGGGGARPAPQARPPAQAPAAAPPPSLPPIAGPAPVAGAPPSSAPRTPERAIAEGQAALGRGDYPAAEAAAREALRSRGVGPRATDAQMLLADSLAGKRDFAGAALAFNEAYSRNRGGPRAPEALVGLAGSFNALGNRREACETLNDLRSGFPNLRGSVADRANAMRQRIGCR